MKHIWFILGGICLGLAFLGVLLPLLPTVPFLLLSAFFFAKSSNRVHDWLLTHNIFGDMIKDWYERGAIDKKAKYFSTLSILFLLVISIALDITATIIYIQVVILSLVLLFIWSRPDK